VRQPVTTNAILATAVSAAFRHDREPLAIDDLIERLAAGLLAADPGAGRLHPLRRHDLAAVARARSLLDAETTRVVSSEELEAVTGLTRFELARQFRAVVGTSPYRYSLLRRLDAARARIAQGQPLVDVALAAGFADQAHLTRRFVAAFGLTPGQYGALVSRVIG
jgi:AraC-like DNA-binding protein